MIEISNINKKYTSKTKEDVLAIQDVNLKFNTTGLVFILGKSGSGKSTFLNILGGLDSANTSRIFLNGKKLNRFNETILSEYRNTYIGFVFQEYNLLDNLNVYDNVALALQVIGAPRHRIVADVPRVLGLVGLDGKEKRQMSELSGGERQRVAIARAMVNDPQILLADEPTGNLDSDTGLSIMRLLNRINSTGTTVVMATHDQTIVNQMRKRVVELKDGVVVRDQARGVYGGGQG